MDGVEEPTSSGWRSSGLRPQRGRMTGFLVAILGGGGVVRSTVTCLVAASFPGRLEVVEAVGGGGWRWWWNVWRGDEGDAMTCRRRMPADGSSKKDYRAGPCMPRLAIPLASSSTTSPATQGQSCTVCHRLHGLHRVHLSNSPAPPSFPAATPHQHSSSSGGFGVPPASSQASLKRVFHASPGAAHVWARWKLPHSGPEG
jgi:hypothetical protein